MRFVPPPAVAIALLVASNAHAQSERREPVSAPASAPADARALPTSDESQLARSAKLETVLRIALERNRDLAEDQARTGAAEARHQAASRLPDLEAKYEQWGVPLARPFALGRSDTLMVGVRQTFPAWGVLDARERAAGEDVGSAKEAARARRQDVAAQVRRTFAAYYRTDQEVRLHLEHAGLTSRVLELARLNQQTGRGSLQDVLRLDLELTRLHTDIARVEREQRSSRALLNALMDRAPDAPLGPPEELVAPSPKDVTTLDRGLDANRPELGAASRAVRRGEATVDEMRRAARFPTLMVGVDYWYMPMNMDTHHGYGAMVGINLPWLSGRRRDQQREAEQMLRAEQYALQSTRNAVRYELRDAAARADSARQSFRIIDQDLLIQARRSLEAMQASYAAGQGDASGLLDALRSYLQVRIERLRALAEVASSDADLERAAGTLAEKEGAR